MRESPVSFSASSAKCIKCGIRKAKTHSTTLRYLHELSISVPNSTINSVIYYLLYFNLS